MKTKGFEKAAAPQKKGPFTADGIRIRDLTREGEGIGSLADGRVVFVEGAVPGDIVTIEMGSSRKGILRGRLVKLEKRSPHRVDPPCPHFAACGGCMLMNLEYQKQMAVKTRLAPEALKRIGGFGDISLSCEALPPQSALGYRNKGIFRIRRAARDGRPIIGMFAGGSRNLVEINSCLIQAEGNNRSLDALRKRLEEIARNGSDAENRALDALEEITLRQASGGDSMIVLGFSHEACSKDREDRFGEEMARSGRPGRTRKKPSPGKIQALLGKALVGNGLEGASSIWCGVARSETAGIDPYTAVHLRGPQRIRETVGKSTFKIGPCSFFQVNSVMAGILVETVRQTCSVSPRGNLLDLYCGAGLFSVCLSDSFEKVTGIESSKSAVMEAVANAEANLVNNASFICGDAAEALSVWAPDKSRDLTILLDPPRRGCGPAVAAAMTRLGAARIIYVSCDPATLARDGALLRQNGYDLTRVTGLDMFPQTMHMETLAVFEGLGF